MMKAQHLPKAQQKKPQLLVRVGACIFSVMAGATGLEPAASGVTGRRYNQLNYAPAELRTIRARTREVNFS